MNRVRVLALRCAGTMLVLLTVQWPAHGQDQMTPYINNPILTYGPPGTWDSGAVFLPKVVVHQGVYYLFYSGTPHIGQTLSIGLATSTDGLSFSKHPANPIFRPDQSGFD